MTDPARGSLQTLGPASKGLPAGGRWPWALAFVASLHLLTIPLTWIVTDQSEMIVMARRLLERGSPTLAPDGARPVPEAPWIPRSAGRPVRSRLHPGTSLAMLPLVAADRALALDGPPHLGRLVHLQGLLCVLGTLAIVGAAARRLGAADGGVALAIGVLGTCWPVWLVSRNGGAEPLVALLLCGFVATGLLSAAGAADGRRAALLRAALLVLLPWIHPTGAVLAVALAAAAGLTREGRRREALPLLLGAALGCGTLVLLWNVLYHGHWWAGGYAQVGGERFFGATAAARGLLALARDSALQAPFVAALAGLALLKAGRRALPWLREPALALAALLALFATYYEQETARRLAVAWPAFGIAAALGWGELRAPAQAARVVLLASLALGCYWFQVQAGAYYEAAPGVFLPGVFWSELAMERGWSAAWLLPVTLLLAALAGSARRATSAGPGPAPAAGGAPAGATRSSSSS